MKIDLTKFSKCFNHFRIIFTIFGLLLISSTTYDVLMRQQEKQPHKLYIAFSVYTNGQKLYDITKPKSKNSIDCLNGLRAISLMFVVFGHRIFTQFGSISTNGLKLGEFFETPVSATMVSFHIWVDTFFVMGGLLVTISILNALDK
jgi:hypothetical protein